jgi:hypothetical protein
MIKAGMVAIAHLTIRTTIEPKGILMSVTTTFPESADMLIASSHAKSVSPGATSI